MRKGPRKEIPVVSAFVAVAGAAAFANAIAPEPLLSGTAGQIVDGFFDYSPLIAGALGIPAIINAVERGRAGLSRVFGGVAACVSLATAFLPALDMTGLFAPMGHSLLYASTLGMVVTGALNTASALPENRRHKLSMKPVAA